MYRNIFVLILLSCHLTLMLQQKQENSILNSLTTLTPSKNSLRQITLTDEKIPFYRENDMPIFIINKLNSKFNFNLNVNNKMQIIDNNYDLATSTNSIDSSSMYTLLYADKKSFLVGSKNRLFNFSMDNFFNKESLIRKINWTEKNHCKTQFYQNECENYIRGSIPLLDGNLMIACGTNFNQPYCRKYTLNKSTQQLAYGVNSSNKTSSKLVNLKPQPIQMTETFSSTQNIPPYSYDNSIYYFHSSLQSQDIFKQNFLVDSKENVILNELITMPQGAILNPNFRTSYGFKDKVYFFFSESELSHFRNGVSFKTPHSLVGEICANDDGRSSFSGGRRFLTFKKAIINCYVPDYEMFHVKYTEIQEATKPVKLGDDDIFYAIFTIRRSANLFDSALCMYKMSQIEETLKGRFKNNNPQKSPLTNPLDSCEAYKSMNNREVGEYYKDITKNEKFQMEQTVNQKAIFALNNVKFTSIAVDATNNNVQILFVGLNDGRILKIMNQMQIRNGQNFNQPIIIGEYQIFSNNLAVNSLILYESKKLVAITNREIKSISLDVQCQKYRSCRQCVYAQDPYCSWSTLESKCVFTTTQNQFLIQDIQNGDGIKICKATNAADTDIYYSINTSMFDDGENQHKIEQYETNSSKNSSIIFMIIFFTAILTSVFSVCLTWVYIKKRYETRPKDELIGPIKEADFASRLWQNIKKNHIVVTVLNYLTQIQNSNSDHDSGKTEHFHDHNLLKQPKILNCYESSHGICKTNNSGLNPVTINTSTSTKSSTRPNSSSEDSSPTTTSSLTASSNNNSPNNLGSKCSRASCECDDEDDDNEMNGEENGNLLTPVSSEYSNIIITNNQRLSSSDDSFLPVIIRTSQSKSSNRNSNINSNNSNNYFKISQENSTSSNQRVRELDL